METSHVSQVPVWSTCTATTKGAFFVFFYKKKVKGIFGRPREVFFRELFSAVDQGWCKTAEDLYQALHLGSARPQVTIEHFISYLKGLARGLLQKEKEEGLSGAEASFLGPLMRLIPGEKVG